MNRPTDNERLFADALAEASPAGFREGLFSETLRLARRRRHLRAARRVGIVTGITAALAVWLWPRTTSQHPNPATTITSYRLIETEPLPPSAVVTTHPFTSPVIASTPPASIITTAEASDGLHLLTDDELLSLAPVPSMLVRLGPHSAELIFPNQSQSE